MKNKFIFLILGMFLLIGTLNLSSADTSPYCALGMDITTASPSNIGTYTATLRGTASHIGDVDEMYVGFAYREDGTTDWYSVAGSFRWIDGFLGEDYSYSMSGLDANTKYNYKAIITQYKIGVDGYSYTCDASFYYSFTTEPNYIHPTINDLTAINVDENSALLRVDLDSMGDATSIDMYFSIREQGGAWSSVAGSFDSLTAPQTYTYSVTGLDEGTTYDFRGVYEYDLGTDGYSGDTDYNSFTTTTTTSMTPTISLNTATLIEENGATIRGNVDSLGDYTSVDVKFFYKSTSISGPISPISASETTETSTGGVSYILTGLQSNTEYEYDLGYYDTDLGYYVLSGETTQKFTTLEESFVWTNTTKTNQTTIGLFDESLTGLDANTNYSFRACVEQGDDLVCNDTLTFTTLSLTPPSITTLTPTNIGNSYANLKGDLTSLGDYTTVDVSFSFKEANASGFSTLLGSQQTLSSIGEFNFNVTGLDENTTYIFYAVAFEVDEYFVEGTELNFSTTAGEPIPPVEISNLPDILMNFSDNYVFDFYDYYEYYDTLKINIDGFILDEDGGGTLGIPNPILGIDLVNNRYLQFQTYDVNQTYTVYYNVTNIYDTLERNFTLQILEGATTTPITPIEEEEEGELDKTILGKITELFMNIFPDSEQLTTAQKIGVMFVTMILVSLLIIGLTFATTKNITMGMMWFVMIVNVLLFFFFAGSGYVPIGFIVVIGLLLLAYGVLKIKGRSE